MDNEAKGQTIKDLKDCLECRLISGFGCIGIGIYLFSQAQRRMSFEKHAINLLATGAFVLGFARLLYVPLVTRKKPDT